MKVYRIRDKDGRYSSGGMDPDFTKGGKTWANIGHLKNHLRQFMDRYSYRPSRAEVYIDAEIVEIEVKEEELKTTSVIDMMSDMVDGDIADYEKGSYKSEYTEKRLKDSKDGITLMKAKRDEAR